MTLAAGQKDLIVLAADPSMKVAIEDVLRRHHALGIRAVSADVISHPLRDPGVLRDGHNFLRAQRGNYGYALAVCDRHGCGNEALSRERLESSIEQGLFVQWADRAAAIVIDPELETWVWTDSPHVAHAVGWSGDMSSLRAWLRTGGLLAEGSVKPADPKAALEALLRFTKRRKSSALFEALAREVSLQGCICPAFRKMTATLQCWFPAAGDS